MRTIYYIHVLAPATVAIVKSRDMHWGLLAQKDHKDISLASLRLLLVADGANPCEYTHNFCPTSMCAIKYAAYTE